MERETRNADDDAMFCKGMVVTGVALVSDVSFRKYRTMGNNTNRLAGQDRDFEIFGSCHRTPGTSTKAPSHVRLVEPRVCP